MVFVHHLVAKVVLEREFDKPQTTTWRTVTTKVAMLWQNLQNSIS